MNEKEFSTSDAQRKAIAKYDEKFEKIMARLAPGTKKRIKDLGYASANAFILKAVEEKLEKEESYKKK